MRRTSSMWPLLAVGFVALLAVPSCTGGVDVPAVPLDSDDIGGVVTSTNGPEAGVWVIAETSDLPTGYRKIVVTDDEGQYVLPDLPEATYSIWVRGYGLVDSSPVASTPGTPLDLTAVVAPSPEAAAQVYPAYYWYSLLEPPPASDFPGTGPDGNGIPTNIKSQGHYLGELTLNGCVVCHQMGTKVTREMPQNMGTFDSTREAWERRVVSGQSGAVMNGFLSRLGRDRALDLFADWTDRIAAGELPPQPPRPSGVERNLVLSMWDWGMDGHQFVHDNVSTDKRNPTLNGYGPIYGGTEYSSDTMPVLDPTTHVTVQVMPPFLDAENPPDFAWSQQTTQPSPAWGEEAVFTSRTSAHSLMMDTSDRVWITSNVRPAANPDWCQEGSSHPSASKHPLANSGRQLSMFDPATDEWTALDTCYGTHHVQFDQNDVLWFSTLGQNLGYFDTRTWEETGDVQASQGWMPFILDTNGNGTQDAYVEPGDAPDAAKDTRVALMNYGVIPNPADGSVWVVTSAGAPGAIMRVVPGENPPETALTELYELPYMNPEAPVEVWGTRGIDIDTNGILWAGTGAGYMASFDRSKCTVTNGPTATGQHCVEGWTFYDQPIPNFKGVEGSGSTDSNYYTFVDQFNTAGLGENVPFALGNNSDSLKATLPDGQMVMLRVPYPMGFHPKGMDGRIDDPDAGWKGRGLWSAYAGQVMWHIEGGKGQKNKLIHFQVRPDPLAK